MSSVEDCPFCNLKERVLKDNKLAQAFLSNPRKTEGHFLITPKRHVEKPWELTKDEVLDVFELIVFIQKKIIGQLGDGTTVRQNYWPFIEQGKVKVDHVHYHVIPRSFEDRIYQISEKHDQKLWQDLSDEEHDRIAKLLD